MRTATAILIKAQRHAAQMMLVVSVMSYSAVRGEALIPLPKDSELVIESITINNGSIFDLENTEENRLFYRLANRLHASTRPHVIEQQLLFEVGELASPQAIGESERILRKNRYIQDAEITLIRRDNEAVDVNVDTTDTWSLMPKLSFTHSGGASSTDLGLKESNLLGTGVGIELLYESDVDRDSTKIKIVDKQLGNSWYGVKAITEDNSDGYLRLLEFGKPFYSLDSNESHGLGYLDEDRKFVYPFVGIEFVQDEFEEAINFDQIGTKEDRFVGSSFSARIGAAQKAFGSSTDAWLLDAGARTSISKSKTSSLDFSSAVSTRLEQGNVANLLLNLGAKYYKRLSKKRLFFARLNGSYGHNLDIDEQMYLGGDNGLRGYPLRYQTGDKRALLTLEQRFYTDWYPFRLFRVG